MYQTCGAGVTGVQTLAGLKNLGQFGCKSALGFMFALFSAAAPFHWPVASWGAVGSLLGFGGAGGSRAAGRAFGGLGRIRSKDLVLERRPVEAADDGLHFVSGGCLDKRESFGFLRLMVPNDLDGICDQIFRGEPLFNVVRSDPSG